MELRLHEEEARYLRDLLDRAYGDLKYEISDTDDSKFKSQLHHEKALLEGLLTKLSEAGVLRAS
jgi:hypothetical protein